VRLVLISSHTQAECGRSIDENVGRLLDYLDAERLSENTMIIYTSDQGFFLG
jgi:arylsulfatase A-like enzyme